MKPLDPVGRATRALDERLREIWRLSPADRQVYAWLVWLSSERIGGFVEHGEDAHGFWLVRATGETTLAQRLRERSTPPFDAACALMADVADRLALCEGHGLFPGPINPHNLTLDGDDRVTLRADPLVAAYLGAPASHRLGQSESISSRWLAPEQAAGAPWDAAGNRYVVGLLLYRLLAGENPFGGAGLRLGLEQARRGAPPIRDDVARTLPPGLQSFCLRLLDPDPGVRPGSAREISDRLRSFVAPPQPASSAHAIAASPSSVIALPHAASTGPADSPTPVAAADAPGVRAPTRPPPPSRTGRRILGGLGHALAFVVPLVGGTALGLWGVGRASPDTGVDADERTIAVSPTRPTVTAQGALAQACASCHPAQTVQWQRSVMGHAAKSPLFQALEILIQEQVAKDQFCRHGAGILRKADPAVACREATFGRLVTGSGGEHWCVNCHSPSENLREVMPAWDGQAVASRSRLPLRDLLPAEHMEGIGCAFCHQVHGPVAPGNEARGLYEGNATWTSFVTGLRYEMRPEDRRGLHGIANSGYALDPAELDPSAPGRADAPLVPGGAHRRPSDEARAYLASSEFCGACHDVRLFGTDGLGVQRGEHFKRLRNAYSEWVEWADAERRNGREPANCQDCHMSAFPGVCAPSDDTSPIVDARGSRVVALERACPPGTRFASRDPGSFPEGPVASASSPDRISTHYFSGVDVPLAPEFPEAMVDQPTLDANGIPLGAVQRRDMLLGRTFSFGVEAPDRDGRQIRIPVVIENVGAGHRVPAGFSQEREFWVHLRVTDGNGELVYEVGRVDRDDEDLRDKIFVRVNTSDTSLDGQGRPLGVFGADVEDGPDVPRWSPPPELGGREFRGRGLINLQNGFLRCVQCIGFIDAEGRCQPRIGQERFRADRFDDAPFDFDTGLCQSNLDREHQFFETYFPVGALDSTRGVVKGPDVIVDTRSAPPGVPLRFTYELPIRGFSAPFNIEARLLFRAFPPFLVKAFADYESRQAAKGLRPSGPLVTLDMLERLEVVELHRVETVVP